jgi:hypothetical protein
MCTMIVAKAAVTGCGKGPDGWFDVDHVYVGYDHPYRAQMEHAVLIDFVNEAAGVWARTAVELDVASARAVAEQILHAVARAEASERGADSPGPPALHGGVPAG